MRKIKIRNGFSLVEMAVVVIIVGLLSVAAAESYKNFLATNQYAQTRKNINMIKEALGEFAGTNIAYPCPARLDRGIDSPEYGVAFCPPAGNPAVGQCANGYCRALGRDIDGPGGPLPPEVILIGAVPSQTINNGDRAALPTPIIGVNNTDFPSNAAVDAWSHRITYAVTENLTTNSAVPFNSYNGAIGVVDENDLDVTIGQQTAHIVLISHGRDGSGAYNTSGEPAENLIIDPISGSTVSTCISSNREDSENCDNDGIFRSAVLAIGQDDGYYDDIVVFRSFENKSVWNYAPRSLKDVYNTGGGSIGIGTNTPQARLDFSNNDLKAAGDIHSRRVCDSAGQNCFDPQLVGGTGINCPPGEAAVVIAENAAQRCEPIVTQPANPNQSCPNDPDGNPTFIVGIRADGIIQCCPIINNVAQCPPPPN